MLFAVNNMFKLIITLMRPAYYVALSLVIILAGQAHAESLIIWASNEVNPRALQDSGKQFTTDTGVSVEVKSITGFKAMKAALASNRQRPDIIIWPHNRFGHWAEEQILRPVKPSKKIIKDLSDEWHAVTYAGEVYGYPISLQGPVFIVNKQLVKKAPKSWDDLQKLSESLSLQGKVVMSWDYTNIYLTYPLLSAEGGFLFEPTKKGWDIESMGVSNDGSVQGLTLLKSLVSADVLPPNAGYRQSAQLFSSSKSAMTIDGPWSWQTFRRSGVDLGVASFPKVKNNHGKGLYTVMSAGITMSSEQENLAKSFIEHYIFSDKTLSSLASKQSPAQYTHKNFMKAHMKELQDTDEVLARNLEAAIAVWQEGEPLPNVSALPGLNNHMAIAIHALISGRMGVSEALEEVANNF